jgi:hypothetical protein
MAVSADADRLNANADLIIIREIMSYFVASRLTSDDEVDALIARITDRIHSDLELAERDGAEHADNQRTRYRARLKLFADSVNYYRTSLHL